MVGRFDFELPPDAKGFCEFALEELYLLNNCRQTCKHSTFQNLCELGPRDERKHKAGNTNIRISDYWRNRFPDSDFGFEHSFVKYASDLKIDLRKPPVILGFFGFLAMPTAGTGTRTAGR